MKLNNTIGKDTQSYAKRMPKKNGRLRGNLTGKKTTVNSRSVITGDSSLEMIEVGVPQNICEVLLQPETVNSWNIEKLTAFFKNGKKYPGCEHIYRKDWGSECGLDKLNRDYNLPPVRRDMVDFYGSDSYDTTFVESALITRVWADPEPEESDIIFANMIANIMSDRFGVTSAIATTEQQLSGLLK